MRLVMENKEIQMVKKELTMMLLYLCRFTETDNPDEFRAWKGYDFDILNQLDDEEYIWQGMHPYRTKAIWLTEDGIEYGKKLLKEYGICDWQ